MLRYSTLRPLLFALPPETAHRLAIRALQLGFVPTSRFSHPSLTTSVAGLILPNPIGLAAGFDKNAECMTNCLRAGFGFVEIGTVTPRAQPGNPRPRLFRLVESRALINRLGFNNQGADAAVQRLKKRSSGIVGGNIGKNKESVNATADYVAAMQALYPHVDYVTANISSPNTPGLRDLQQADELRELITALHGVRAERVAAGESAKPLFIKIAPDNSDDLLAQIAHIALDLRLDGLIVSNTTLSRVGVLHHPQAGESGGLSGAPLRALATEQLRKIYRLTGGAIPLIATGGIASAEEAYSRIRAGASALQLYTGLIYEGFRLVERMNRELVDLLLRDGFTRIHDAVGVNAE